MPLEHFQPLPGPSASSDGACHLANLRRLVTARWGVLAIMLALTLVVPGQLDVALPQLPLLAILAITALCNAVVHYRSRTATSASAADLSRQLLIDIASLAALLFFSGGATNPLVSLLLPPVAIAALTLPARHVAFIGLVAVAGYSALLVSYLPLPLADAARATRLHLVGMWLTFAVSAAMIAWFILRMTRLIRQRDAELAAAREQALRDERVLALGTLAAGAAHELGTPLGTMMLIAGELARDPALPPAVHEDIALLGRQIAACREIITGLSQRAGAERLENTPVQAVDRWLEGVRQRWHALRPHTQTVLAFAGEGRPPGLLADPRLEQALHNLLNNAAQAAGASGVPVDIRVDWNATHIRLEVHDCGPGFPAAVLEEGGFVRFPAHAHGQGVGLMLTRSSIEQLGGQLALHNAPGGGAIARITLPGLAQ